MLQSSHTSHVLLLLMFRLKVYSCDLCFRLFCCGTDKISPKQSPKTRNKRCVERVKQNRLALVFPSFFFLLFRFDGLRNSTHTDTNWIGRRKAPNTRRSDDNNTQYPISNNNKKSTFEIYVIMKTNFQRDAHCMASMCTFRYGFRWKRTWRELSQMALDKWFSTTTMTTKTTHIWAVSEGEDKVHVYECVCAYWTDSIRRMWACNNTSYILCI